MLLLRRGVVSPCPVPLSSTRFGWSVMTSSIQEGFLLGSKFVGSEPVS